jgi:hypothetical protein
MFFYYRCIRLAALVSLFSRDGVLSGYLYKKRMYDSRGLTIECNLFSRDGDSTQKYAPGSIKGSNHEYMYFICENLII